jgi:branched-chain amino acid transport system substrate-binding protein
MILVLCFSMLPGCERDRPVLRIGCQRDRSFEQGVMAALEEINRQTPPFRFEVAFDASASIAIPHQAVESAAAFCADPEVVAVIGYASSDASLAASEIFRRRKTPQIVPKGTSIQLRDSSEWTFKLCPDDRHQAKFLADQAVKEKAGPRCAVVYQNNDYGRGLARLFKESLEHRGGRIVFMRPASSGIFEADTDFLDVYAREIIDLEPDRVCLFCLPYQAILILQAFGREGHQFSLLGSDSLDTPAVFQPRGEALIGIHVSLFYHYQIDTAGNRAFTRAFEARYGRFPQASEALAYDAVFLLYEACKAGARTREDVRRYLAELGRARPAHRGVTGDIAFNDKNACPRPIFLGEIRSGRISLLEQSSGRTGRPVAAGRP